MKLFKRYWLTALAFVMTLVISGYYALGGFFSFEKESTNVRTVQLSNNELDYQAILNEFEDSTLTTEGVLTTFTGYQAVDLSIFEEIDCVSVSNEDSTCRVYYQTTHNSATEGITLSAVIEGSEESIIDQVEGVLVADEEGFFDVVFEFDGEILLLSELINAGLVNECGFFSSLFSKVQKVWNSTVGKIGTIVTVAACAVVGVVCAVVPGGQLVTAVCAGAVVGLVGGGITAGVSTYVQDGKVDWDAVLVYAGVGAVAGAATSALAYGATTAIKGAFSGASSNIKSFNSYKSFKNEFGSASKYVNNGQWHHIVEQQTVTKGINSASSVYNTQNTVAISQNLHQQISTYYSTYNSTYGMTFRNYINTLPFEQQYAEGLRILNEFAKKLGETIYWL